MVLECKFCGYESDGRSPEGNYDSDKQEFTCVDCLKRNSRIKEFVTELEETLNVIKKLLE